MTGSVLVRCRGVPQCLCFLMTFIQAILILSFHNSNFMTTSESQCLLTSFLSDITMFSGVVYSQVLTGAPS